MKDKTLKNIAYFIIQEVKCKSDESMSGFQLIVEYSTIEQKFSIEINSVKKQIIKEYLYKSNKVADVELNTEGFDVVLYIDNI